MENGNITDSQFEIFKQFKKSVADLLTPNDIDPFLLKWLRTKNYNLRKAEATFRETFAFREFFGLDTITKTYRKPEVAVKYEYSAFLGYAKDGSIVRYTALGRGDHYGFIGSMSAYQLGRYALHIMEEDKEHQIMRQKITGENAFDVTYVFDLAGLTAQDILHKCVYETGMDLIHLAQEFYPDMWGHVFFINAPSYFDTLFNVFKPVFRMDLIQKLQVLSRESTAEILLNYIDEDVLPTFLGGRRVNSTGMGSKDFFRLGGRIPDNYYLCNQPYLSPSDVGAVDVLVGARRSFTHTVVIRKPDTTIRVEVRTERGSIHMSVYYRKFYSDGSDIPLEDDGLDENGDFCKLVKVSPVMRVQTHMSPINDVNVAKKPGIYIYRFCNASSWFAARRLIFRIRVDERES